MVGAGEGCEDETEHAGAGEGNTVQNDVMADEGRLMNGRNIAAAGLRELFWMG